MISWISFIVQSIRLFKKGIPQSINDFVRIIKQREFFFIIFLLLLFLPPENFYERLRIKFKRPLARAAEVGSFGLPEELEYPLNVVGQKPPMLTAKSVVIIDVPSAVPILVENSKRHLHQASTTKIMTALIVLGNYKLNDVLTVPNLDGVIGKEMGLKEGERMTVENLLYGLLLQSASDAAFTLASSYPGGVEQFVYSMNEKAKELSLFNTHFVNISGIDQINHYSTADDLAYLTTYAMKNPVFAKIVGTSEIIISDLDKKHWYDLENTNELLGKVFGVKGVKTGWTEEAGECLVSYIERNGKKIIIVILGSSDRFGETKKLINWVFKNYQWQKVILSTQD